MAGGSSVTPLLVIPGAVNDAAPSVSGFVTNLPSAVNDFYDGSLLIFTSGALAGQSHQVDTYTGATKAMTFAALDRWTSAPANGDTFDLAFSPGNYLKKMFAAIGDPSSDHLTSIVAKLGNPSTDLATLISAIGSLLTDQGYGLAELATLIGAIPTINHALGFLEFWNATPVAKITLPDTTPASLALPAVVLPAGAFPAGFTVVQCIPLFKFGMRLNLDGANINELSGGQYIQVRKGGGSYITCINWADAQLWTDVASPGPGDVRVGFDPGNITAADTYQFQWLNAIITGVAGLELHDVEVGIRIYLKV